MSSFTDALINKIHADTQVAGLQVYADQISESEKAIIAEKVGRSLSGQSGANGVDGTTLADFIDATYGAFSEADIGRWILISGSSNGNDGFYNVVGFTSATEVVLSPALPAAEASLVWQMYREPNLEDDVNLALTQLREIVDPANDWFQALPRAFDPTNTDAGSTKNEKLSMKTLADNWYGTHTKIVEIITGSLTVADTDTGELVLTGVSYADPANRSGLVIQSSTANSGSYHDEVALASIVLGLHKVILIDTTTGAEFKSAAGDVIYGVLQDGADITGAGEGTDVFVKFITSIAGTPTNYTWTAADPTSIQAYIPQRKRRTSLLEYDDRRAFSASIVGDAELAEDIDEIRDALGIADGEGAGDWDLTNTSASYPFSELTLATATMEDIVNKLNEEIGDRLYTEDNFVTDGQTITESIDALDQAIGAIGDSTIKSKIIERLTVDIARGALHTIPFATGSDPAITTYLVDSADRGLNMDVYAGGNKLLPDSAGLSDGDYEEFSNTQIRLRFRVKTGQALEYIIKDDA